MCGISILISKANLAVPQDLIRDMNDRVSHRGPDGEGFYSGVNFAFGHRRLSIIDLSHGGDQPMEKGGDWLVFNGMIYNYIELREELITLGHQFHSHSDTEVLLAACLQWGIKAFDRLNGMWAFAWYRQQTNDIIFCRDRFGIKPLFYTTSGDFFGAGSEIKQFHAVPGFQSKLNKKAAVNFLTNGYLNYAEDTFFEGVHELRAGHYLHYHLDTHKYSVHQWYNLDKAAPPISVSWQDAKQQVRALFNDSLKIRLRADVKLGSCLSGGLDSSSIVSNVHAQKLGPMDFVTITSCYEQKEYDEQQFSDLVSAATGFKAIKTFPRLQDMLDKGELDEMIFHQEQPLNSASNYSEHEVFKTAKSNNLKVMLDGQGADEYICGYNEFYIAYLGELVQSGRIKKLWQGFKRKSQHQKTSVGSYVNNYLRTVALYPVLPRLKKIMGRNNHPWLNPDWKSFAEKNLIHFSSGNIRSLSLCEMSFTSLPMQLHSEDRNSMKHAIESRLPYLDHRLVEYILSLPSHFKIANGFSKYIVRETLDELPEAIRYRKDKMGFVAPDELWIRENHEQVRAELGDAIAATGIFSENLLHRFDQFIDRKLGFEPLYFRAITLNRLIRIFSLKD
ncbi:asparagine synthase (glutamine-hydrolyzing) [Segetibacter sp. 3557_3]|uniref:asparagine synthase (glutamine-hydrolyzing) n=1 Tax=Segetibacter sp. 3557_3 TaxID=2547429 RepID=UPI0010586D64|nr:asparagine synthase (glutamine-hydrolyzing) [Segetibacter sp. 3557_3]TDH23299.1 asparagine synthase (glutamine-hydrolyzing) [Segetibacter sp. 3557_3]